MITLLSHRRDRRSVCSNFESQNTSGENMVKYLLYNRRHNVIHSTHVQHAKSNDEICSVPYKRDLLSDISGIVSQKRDLLSDMSQKRDLLSDIVSQ